jgi:hypothetical protein
MAQRLLHVITKVYYRSMSCFATVFPSKALLVVHKLTLLSLRGFELCVTTIGASP